MISTIGFYNVDTAWNSRLFDEMLMARKKVFTDRLGWVPSMNDREVDQFDTYKSQPLYMVVTNPEGGYEGSCRFISTSKPNMLADVFPYLISSDLIPCDPDILEVSRFHAGVGTNAPRKRGINQYIGELCAGIGEFMYRYDYEKMIMVCDERMVRVLKIAQADPQLVDPTSTGYVEEDGIKSFVIWIYRDRLDAVMKMFNIEKVEMVE
jgi:N-acyl-L-homoserine lactone synthetase